MNITSAEFVKGVVGSDKVLEDGIPQIAFVGRSNVGKSSVINSLAGQKNLARTSSAAGRTSEINLFLINKTFYLVDLPGYGFAHASWEDRERIQKLIYWYLLNSHYEQKKIVLIIDANVGATDDDLRMLHSLEEQRKNIIVVANKVDKIKKSGYSRQLQKIQSMVGDHKVIPYSAEKKIGVSDLINEVFE
ncbi:MAG: ribosome biogenesis GTP-binding protein YihA/YsxC [bacterium]|nr:ribosome biogenesis GTP-binding protein YihA/YsxC [bacterium]